MVAIAMLKLTFAALCWSNNTVVPNRHAARTPLFYWHNSVNSIYRSCHCVKCIILGGSCPDTL